MDLCTLLCELAILHSKNFNVEHYMKTFQPNVFIHGMLIGTIGFCHFIPLLVTLARSCKVSTKQNLVASFSCTLFH